ncbi:MAG: ferrous iron transport protein A [Candidatus Bathyarchaeia archaeon]
MFGFRRSLARDTAQPCCGQHLSLASLNEGETGVMIRVEGGFNATRRLAEMGLTPGSEVKLLRKCAFHGPVEIEVRGVALAIGHGLASKVCVEPLKAKSDE